MNYHICKFKIHFSSVILQTVISIYTMKKSKKDKTKIKYFLLFLSLFFLNKIKEMVKNFVNVIYKIILT